MALAAAYLALALHGLGGSDIVGDDEAREAGLVQEILRGHVFLPQFNGEMLPDKPILYHWLAAVSCLPRGFSETAVRLPSAAAGAALVYWTARFGAHLLGARAGLVAAGLVATMPALFTHVRRARPDALLVLLLSMALGSAYRWWRDGTRRDATAALVLLGFGVLAKGPVVPVLFALAFGGFLAWQGELSRLPRLLTVPGMGALLVLALGWYAVALVGWGDLFVREHLVGRYLRNLAGGLASDGAYSRRSLTHHLLFYPKHLPAVLLPWTPLVAVALWQAWRAGGLRDPRLRLLLCWAVAPIVAFTPAEWKLRYYLLPSVPALALLTAPAMLRLWEARPRRVERPGLAVLAAAVAVVGGLAAWAAAGGRVRLSLADQTALSALLPLAPGGARGAAAAVGFAAGVLLVALAWRAWRVVVGLVAAGAALWMAAGTPALERAVGARDSLRPFAEEIGRRWPEPAPLAFHPELIRTVVVYAGRRIPTIHRLRDISPGTALVTSAPTHEALTRAGRVGPPLLTGEGRVGSLARGGMVVAATLR